MSELLQATRRLRNTPGFTATAVLTIALGIGATTAIFSVVNAVLLRPLPYPDAGRLVLVTSDLTARKVRDFPLPPGDLPDLREQGTLLHGVAAVTLAGQAPLAGDGGEPEQVSAAAVTPDLFPLLGAGTVLGRTFTEEDAAPLPPPPNLPAGAPAPAPPPGSALLSYGFWQRRYGGDPKVIGRVIHLGGGSSEVIGVLAPDVELLFPPDLRVDRAADVYQALRIDWATASRINVFLRFVGRLKAGVTVPQAQVDRIVVTCANASPSRKLRGCDGGWSPCRSTW